ncbi:Hsp20/alpha crystallin family protein [Desulfonatronovibrio hydrogenovorans]|uniref:Hsp20/alpha crystallin family protein n=1 Tax=Desulfonatronovibrio hydrogenovorans TaxID=53245 RepID=UPI0012372D68|nr:Hsp20/alpha crystallin family protein [Desulfonatronovibrio hydrogenovorans]
MVSKANPWTEIKSMREEMDRIMNESMNQKMTGKNLRSRLSLWQPVADLYQTEDLLVVEMELPGVHQANVNLEIQGNQLMVYGEKKMEKEATGSAYQMLERSYGPFSRVFILPDNIDSTAIKAVFANGILSVFIPKAAKVKKPVSIKISEN